MLCCNIFYELSTCQLKYFVRAVDACRMECSSTSMCVCVSGGNEMDKVEFRIVHGRTVFHRSFGQVCVVNSFRSVVVRFFFPSFSTVLFDFYICDAWERKREQ